MPFFLQYSAKLLKKPDQCRAVYACSHLFWVDDQENMKDGERCVTAPHPKIHTHTHTHYGCAALYTLVSDIPLQV